MNEALVASTPWPGSFESSLATQEVLLAYAQERFGAQEQRKIMAAKQNQELFAQLLGK